jgi:hypothetical protein
MRSIMKHLLVFTTLLVGATFSRADDVLFTIRSAKGDFQVTEAVVERVGTVTYKALAPGMDDALHEVRGPLMRDVLKAAGIEGTHAAAVALDKYEVEIPMADFSTLDVIAAIEIDGKRLTVRSKGPAWIIYPTGEHTELQKDPVYEARSIWQLKDLVVK